MHLSMLILHFLGLALSLGTMLAFLVMRSSCSKVSNSEYEILFLNTRNMLRLSHLGLGLMLISGGALMTPYWSSLGHMPLLHIKFTVYFIWYGTLIALSVNTRRARRSEFRLCNPRIGFLSYMCVLFGILAISLAVMQFM
jgi:hypothetical protein